MVAENIINKQAGKPGGVYMNATWDEVGLFCISADKCGDSIEAIQQWHASSKVHGNYFPGACAFWERETERQPMR